MEVKTKEFANAVLESIMVDNSSSMSEFIDAARDDRKTDGGAIVLTLVKYIEREGSPPGHRLDEIIYTVTIEGKYVSG